MDTHDYIPVETFCRLYSVEVSFIASLHEFGLIEVTQVNEEKYIPLNALAEVEKMLRLHNDLQINTEGLDVAIHLLQKIENMQTEIEALKRKLRLYEVEE